MSTKSEQVDFGLGFERDLRDFLSIMKLREIDGSANFKLGGFQIDAICRYEDTVIVIECVTAKGRKKLDFFEFEAPVTR